jgi:dTDP-4-dehydrorhamnose 3,5-epimerase-like enzyme
MKVTPTELAEVLIIEPAIYRDDRGAFMETYNERSGFPLVGARTTILSQAKM